MTPAQFVKAYGLKSLNDIARATNVQVRTLSKWYHERPELFRMIVIGVAAEQASRAWGALPDGDSEE